jgi:hypothetical protein
MRLLAPLTALVAALLLAPAAHAAWTWPLRGELITEYRNADDPYAGGQHRGIDIAGPTGAPVVAAAGGEVRFAGTAGSSGLTVSVRTGDGFDTSYLHLSSLAVRAGDAVGAGDKLGAVGTSGRRSAVQPHLHFGVREAGSRHAYREPLDFLPAMPAPPPAQRPDPGPGPLPVPAPRAPAPAAAGRVPEPRPAPREVPRRVPLGERAPRRVPAGGRAPRREPAPGQVREPAPGHAPAPARVSAPAPGHAGEPAPAARPLSQPAPDQHASPTRSQAPVSEPAPANSAPAVRPALGPAGASEPTSTAADKAPAGPGPNADTARGAGPDIGWVLACVGLLLAAGLLASTEDGRKAAGTGRRGLLRVLRPLMGRS